MDLLEYQGKELFAKLGVPVPEGGVATNVDEAVSVAERLGFPVVVKAQVAIGGRGKAGGIKKADTPAQARESAEAILGMDIRGHTVFKVWVEEASSIAREYYAAALFDRTTKKVLMMLSAVGGMDVEEIAARDSGAIAKVAIDPLIGFKPFHARRLAYEAKITPESIKGTTRLLAKIYDAFVQLDATLVEINPVAVTEAGDVVALDSKVSIDENALFRQPEISALDSPADGDPQERMASERGLTYVKLDGNVGILGNGAGLVMSTLDVVAQAGGRPANFLDVGGGATADEISDGLGVILSDPKVDAVLFNVFGGITRCDEVAKGLLQAIDRLERKVPFVVRLDGTNDVVGRELLIESAPAGVEVEATMLEAADRVVALAGPTAGSATGDE